MKRLLTILVVLAISSVGLAQGGRAAEHWVGAWSTAVVVATPLPVKIAAMQAEVPVNAPQEAVIVVRLVEVIDDVLLVGRHKPFLRRGRLNR